MDARRDVSFLDQISGETDRKIEEIRAIAQREIGNKSGLIVGVNGSVARREYTQGSDVDLFFLYDSCQYEANNREIPNLQKEFRDALEKEGFKMPSENGVFENPMTYNDIISPIGGVDDTNDRMTRRILFLLEGEWIYNKDEFLELRKKLIERYVHDELGDEKFSLYLLNDIIRYWRTVCVDFEFKTYRSEKPRAIRLAKLRMSRMLLYFAGIVAVGDASNMPVAQKRSRLEELFSSCAISRLKELIGDDFHGARDIYEKFLEKLNNSQFRKALETPGEGGINTDAYREMKELSQSFKNELNAVIMNKYKMNDNFIKSLIL